MSYFEHVTAVTTGEVNGVLYAELLFWANLMCLPQSLLGLPPYHICLSLALEGLRLAKIKHKLLWLSSSVDGPKHRSEVCVISHLYYASHPFGGQWKLIQNLEDWGNFACSPPSWLLLVINVCTDITPYFKGLLTQQRVHFFYHTSFTNENFCM